MNGLFFKPDLITNILAARFTLELQRASMRRNPRVSSTMLDLVKKNVPDSTKT